MIMYGSGIANNMTCSSKERQTLAESPWHQKMSYVRMRGVALVSHDGRNSIKLSVFTSMLSIGIAATKLYTRMRALLFEEIIVFKIK